MRRAAGCPRIRGLAASCGGTPSVSGNPGMTGGGEWRVRPGLEVLRLTAAQPTPLTARADILAGGQESSGVRARHGCVVIVRQACGGEGESGPCAGGRGLWGSERRGIQRDKNPCQGACAGWRGREGRCVTRVSLRLSSIEAAVVSTWLVKSRISIAAYLGSRFSLTISRS